MTVYRPRTIKREYRTRRKTGDQRALHRRETVEAGAMPARILRSLLRARIEALRPSYAPEAAKVVEASERARIRRWANIMERRA